MKTLKVDTESKLDHLTTALKNELSRTHDRLCNSANEYDAIPELREVRVNKMRDLEEMLGELGERKRVVLEEVK